jgi:CheY-like chemotaxis protein
MTLSDSQEFFRQSAKNLLDLAVSICGVRYGVIRVDGQADISTSAAVDAFPTLEGSDNDLFVEIDEETLERHGAGIRFYAGVALLDANGLRRGTLALMDDHARSLTEMQKGVLLKIAAEVMRGMDRAAAIREASSQAVRVLIVEDDEAVGEGLQCVLEAKGMDVRVVTTGAEVLPAIVQEPPDVIVLDLSLADEDGRRIYERISSAYSIPVIFSSGHAAEAELGDVVMRPHTAFLLKPYQIEDLVNLIRSLISGF